MIKSISVDVDIDMDDLDIDDLAYTLKSRWKYLKPKDKKEISAILSPQSLQIKTLEDQMKFDHIQEIFHKYTLSHIQSVLPE